MQSSLNMGYRNYNIGSFLPVRIHEGNVEIKFNTGIEKYSTRSKLETAWQVNEFYLNEVLFVIEQDGIRYIGRYDGTMSGYSIRDGLLVSVSGFKSPPKPILKVIGATHTLIACAAQLDITRRRIVYAPYTKDEFVFYEPFKEAVFMPSAYADSLQSLKQSLYIYNKNGEEVDCSEKGQWFVQVPYTGVCDSSIF